MATWNSRGLRGSTLEEFINHTCELYREKNLALIQKVPTPITPVQIDQKSRHITLAYFEKKSTVDYIGAVQGIPVCFDAKECSTDTFPLQNIHEHQVAFMRDFERQQGVAFLILYFSHIDEVYYLTSRGGQNILNTRSWNLSGFWRGKEMFWYLSWMGYRETWNTEYSNLWVNTAKRKGTSSEAPFFVY